MGRTFVVADVHGFPELMENALEHGCFDSARDRLVFAGDVVDRGPRVERCFELLKELRATCLLGNHDVAVMMGYWIPGQDRESRVFQEKLRELFLGTCEDGKGSRWEAVLCVDGVIISHAGVAGPHEDSVVAEKGSPEPAALAKGLNELVRLAVEEELETGYWDKYGVLGRCGPLRYRSWECPRSRLSDRFPQIVGHSPPEDELGARVYMIDPRIEPGRDGELSDVGRYRYAVIENGDVCMEWGSLSREGRSRQ